MRILVIEDDYVSRRVLARLLASYGEVDVSADGESGLVRFDEAFGERRPFDLIALDIVMPGLDGQQTLRALRENERQRGVDPAQRARVVMTTALDDVRSVSAAFHELCDAYLVKPIRRETLRETLSELGFAPVA